MTEPTRFEALPDQVQDDLALIMFWCEHYASQAEQAAVERLVDWFAQPHVAECNAAMKEDAP